MTDKPTDGQPEGDGARRTADAIHALIAHRLEAEMAPLLAQLKDVSERVAGLESREIAGPTNSG